MAYRTIKHLSEETDICQDEVRRKVKLMKESGVYEQEIFLTNPIRVESAAFIHFNTYQPLIMSGSYFPEWRKP